MGYTPQQWIDLDPSFPASAARFSYMEGGIKGNSDRLDSVESGKVAKGELVLNIKDYGAVGDGTTNDTAAIQGAIDAAIAAGGGKVWVPRGVYCYDTLSITGQGNIYLTVEGANQAILLANSALTTDSIVIDSPTTTIGSGFVRRIKFKNLMIQGHAYWNQDTRIARRGVVIRQAQDVYFDDVWISHFRQGGLHVYDLFDSVFNNVQILWCGVGESDTDYAYALYMTGELDNSNANHIHGLHMEHCPLTVAIDHRSRHNQFTGCKFEHGTGAAANLSTKSPFYFADSIENSFVNCLFTENAISDTPYIRSDDNTADTYLINFNLKKTTTFTGCSFFANSTASARWYTGFDTTFAHCNFQRCNGATPTFAFVLNSRNVIRDCSITFADAGAGLLRLGSSYNLFANNRIFTSGSGTGNSVYLIDSGAANNEVADNHIIGGATNLISTSLTDLGSNNVRNRFAAVKTTTVGSGAPSVFSAEVLRLNDASAATYTNFVHGYHGMRLLVIANTANCTVANNATIVLKGGADKLLATGESLYLMNVSGVWREV